MKTKEEMIDGLEIAIGALIAIKLCGDAGDGTQDAIEALTVLLEKVEDMNDDNDFFKENRNVQEEKRRKLK